MLADRIREYVRINYVEPAKRAGTTEVTVRAGDVHRQMGLQDQVPVVCDALDTDIFRDRNGLEVVRREGPRHGPNRRDFFCFVVAPAIVAGRFLLKANPADCPNGNGHPASASEWEGLSLVSQPPRQSKDGRPVPVAHRRDPTEGDLIAVWTNE